MEFSDEIIKWYNINKRDLPWRNTTNPYYVWLSEIILQQTRVDQGLPYYLKFTETFPTVFDLANAKQDDVLKLWQGLGYYSRARNLHAAAKQIVENFNDKFPSSKKELLKLKGIGDYTSAAIASFCFKEATAVVDGNVFRVLSRFFGVETPIDSIHGKKQFAEIAQQILDYNKPDLHNQAIMEFGALQCVPKSPDCSSCPLKLECWAKQNNKISTLPIKEKKTKQTIRYFYYLDILYKDSTYIYKRTLKDVWQNLYEFPLIEKKEATPIEVVLNSIDISSDYTVFAVKEMPKHVLSHQKIFPTFIKIKLNQPFQQTNWQLINTKKINNFPTHRLMEKYIENI